MREVCGMNLLSISSIRINSVVISAIQSSVEEFSAFSHPVAGTSPKCFIRGYVCSQCLTEWNTTLQGVSCVLPSSICIVCYSFDRGYLKLASSLPAGLQDFTLLYYFHFTILLKIISHLYVATICIYRKDTNCRLHLSIIFPLAWVFVVRQVSTAYRDAFVQSFIVWWMKAASNILKTQFSFPYSFSAYTTKPNPVADGALCWGDRDKFFCIYTSTSDQIKTPGVIRLVWAAPHCIF